MQKTQKKKPNVFIIISSNMSDNNYHNKTDAKQNDSPKNQHKQKETNKQHFLSQNICSTNTFMIDYLIIEPIHFVFYFAKPQSLCLFFSMTCQTFSIINKSIDYVCLVNILDHKQCILKHI